jgi:tRNA threonylcarbamoyladenosine biosynthesis protein TsaB
LSTFILNIDCSLETAFVSITEDGKTIASRISVIQKEHAGFIHGAIQELLDEISIDLKRINGIGVAIGPGSYTGLRVALATAKGFAYALSVPMVVTSTLEMMAYAAIEATNQTATTDSYFVPLIDARRMEVFTAVYNKHLQLIQEAQSLVLDSQSFLGMPQKNQLYFFGSGAQKFEMICSNSHNCFLNNLSYVSSLGHLSHSKFTSGVFAAIAHCEPLYVKEFFDGNAERK